MSLFDNCIKHPDVGDGGFIHAPPVTRKVRAPGSSTHRPLNDGAFVNTNRALCWRIRRVYIPASRPANGNTCYRPARYGFDRVGLAPAGVQ